MPPKKVSMIDPDFFCRTQGGEWFKLINSTWQIDHDIRESRYPMLKVEGELDLFKEENNMMLDVKNYVNANFGIEYDKIPPALGLPKIWKVIFNPPATIVIWDDLPSLLWSCGDQKKPKRSKTVVKCGEDDIYDPEKGLAMCIAKKALGNQGNYFNQFKKWLPKEEDPKHVVDDKLVFRSMPDVLSRIMKDLKKAICSAGKTKDYLTTGEALDILRQYYEVMDIRSVIVLKED